MSEDDMDFAVHFALSFMLIGGGGLLYSFYRRRSNQKSRIGAVAGFGAQLITIGSFYITVSPVFFCSCRARSRVLTRANLLQIYTGFILHFGLSTDYHNQYKALLMLGVSLLTLGGVVAIVFHHRLYRMPTRDRDTPGFWTQVFLSCRRGFIQQLYNWKGLIFDFGMCILSGLFLGTIYYRKKFVPGLPAWVVTLCGPDFKELCEQPNSGLSLPPVRLPSTECHQPMASTDCMVLCCVVLCFGNRSVFRSEFSHHFIVITRCHCEFDANFR